VSESESVTPGAGLESVGLVFKSVDSDFAPEILGPGRSESQIQAKLEVAWPGPAVAPARFESRYFKARLVATPGRQPGFMMSDGGQGSERREQLTRHTIPAAASESLARVTGPGPGRSNGRSARKTVKPPVRFKFGRGPCCDERRAKPKVISGWGRAPAPARH
jgi:hypothetical protein